MSQLIILNHKKRKTPELSNLPVCLCMLACACVHAQSCLTLATSVHSLQGSSVHGIIQTRILE